jgi:hypothetical protein
MPVNMAFLLSPEVLVIFLRKNYQYKLSSYASEHGLPLKP